MKGKDAENQVLIDAEMSNAIISLIVTLKKLEINVTIQTQY